MLGAHAAPAEPILPIPSAWTWCGLQKFVSTKLIGHGAQSEEFDDFYLWFEAFPNAQHQKGFVQVPLHAQSWGQALISLHDVLHPSFDGACPDWPPRHPASNSPHKPQQRSKPAQAGVCTTVVEASPDFPSRYSQRPGYVRRLDNSFPAQGDSLNPP